MCIPNKSETTKLNILFFTGANNLGKRKGETKVMNALIIMTVRRFMDSFLWLLDGCVFEDMHNAPSMCKRLLRLQLAIYGDSGERGGFLSKQDGCTRDTMRQSNQGMDAQ